MTKKILVWAYPAALDWFKDQQAQGYSTGLEVDAHKVDNQQVPIWITSLTDEERREIDETDIDALRDIDSLRYHKLGKS